MAWSKQLWSSVCALPGRLRSELGEGVISAAIAVLVMAFLGVAMWGLFNTVLSDTSGSITEQIGNIGGS